MSDPALADRPKAKSIRPLAALWPYLRPYRGVLAAAMVALLLASGAMLALPVALKGLIDRGMAVGNADTINIYFGSQSRTPAVSTSRKAWPISARKRP